MTHFIEYNANATEAEVSAAGCVVTKTDSLFIVSIGDFTRIGHHPAGVNRMVIHQSEYGVHIFVNGSESAFITEINLPESISIGFTYDSFVTIETPLTVKQAIELSL